MNNKWFTLTELIISITILSILSTIAFLYVSWNISEARDSKRIADLASIKFSLKTYKQNRWIYPNPGNSFSITNSWFIVANQWILDSSVMLQNLEKLPKDPKNDKFYLYSITKNKTSFQIAWVVENNSNPTALLEWDYKTVSINVLPSISLATENNWNLEIKDWVWSWSENRKKFIFHDLSDNIPYSFENDTNAISNVSDFDELINKAKDKWLWQNSDYRNCQEIQDAWKAISSIFAEEYQIVNNSWSLVNTSCSF